MDVSCSNQRAPKKMMAMAHAFFARQHISVMPLFDSTDNKKPRVIAGFFMEAQSGLLNGAAGYDFAARFQCIRQYVAFENFGCFNFNDRFRLAIFDIGQRVYGFVRG